MLKLQLNNCERSVIVEGLIIGAIVQQQFQITFPCWLGSQCSFIRMEDAKRYSPGIVSKIKLSFFASDVINNSKMMQVVKKY